MIEPDGRLFSPSFFQLVARAINDVLLTGQCTNRGTPISRTKHKSMRVIVSAGLSKSAHGSCQGAQAFLPHL